MQNGKSINFVFAFFSWLPGKISQVSPVVPKTMNTHIFWLLFVSYYPGILSYLLYFFYNKILSWLDHLSRIRYRCSQTQNIWALLKVHINKTKYSVSPFCLFIHWPCMQHSRQTWLNDWKEGCMQNQSNFGKKKNDMPLSLSSSIQLTLHIHTAGCVVGTKTIGSMTNVTSWFIPLDSFHMKHLTAWYNCTWVCSRPSYIGRWVTSSIAVKCHIITLSNRRGTLLNCDHWCIWK